RRRGRRQAAGAAQLHLASAVARPVRGRARDPAEASAAARRGELRAPTPRPLPLRPRLRGDAARLVVLYDPAHFEPLADIKWDEARVRDAIAAVVADTDAAHDPDPLWPAHEWDGWNAPLPLKSLYV